MTRLLIATDGFLPRWDGISSFLHEMIPRIDDHFDISIIAPDFGELKVQYDATLQRFRTLQIRLADNYFASIPKFGALIREIRKADVVFVQCLGPIGVWSIIFANIYKKPVVLYNHMIEWEVFAKSQGINAIKVPINILTKMVARILYNMCTIIIVPAIEQAELLTVLGIDAMKKVVHLGVDVRQYKPADKKKAKERLGIDPEAFVIGYGGRVSFEKDMKTLYRGFVRFSKKHDNVKLLIAGGGRPEIENMLKKKKDVIVTGLQDDLSPFYQAMDVYVLSSLVETTSLTTMEAMATGLPVVATPVGFIKEYINDGTNGLLFPKKNSYALYRHLQFLYDNPKDREKLGKNARDTVVKHYNWDKTAEGIIEVLEVAKSMKR